MSDTVTPLTTEHLRIMRGDIAEFERPVVAQEEIHLVAAGGAPRQAQLDPGHVALVAHPSANLPLLNPQKSVRKYGETKYRGHCHPACLRVKSSHSLNGKPRND